MVERPREFEPHTPQQLFALTMFGFVSLSARHVDKAHVVLLLVFFLFYANFEAELVGNLASDFLSNSHFHVSSFDPASPPF